MNVLCDILEYTFSRVILLTVRIIMNLTGFSVAATELRLVSSHIPLFLHGQRTWVKPRGTHGIIACSQSKFSGHGG